MARQRFISGAVGRANWIGLQQLTLSIPHGNELNANAAFKVARNAALHAPDINYARNSRLKRGQKRSASE